MAEKHEVVVKNIPFLFYFFIYDCGHKHMIVSFWIQSEK